MLHVRGTQLNYFKKGVSMLTGKVSLRLKNNNEIMTRRNYKEAR